MSETLIPETKTKQLFETRQFNLGIQIKEEDGEIYSQGFIATTHPDRAVDSDLGVEGDILSRNVMKQIADFINNDVATLEGIGSTRAVSDVHDWLQKKDASIIPAGMAVPPAEVKEYEDSKGHKDGQYGVFVKTHHNKNHPQYKEIAYDVEHGYKPGYSIEYAPGEYSIIEHEGKSYRFLKTITNFVGYAFATARKIANPKAWAMTIGYKEIEDIAYKIDIKTIKCPECDKEMLDEEMLKKHKAEKHSKEEKMVDEQTNETPAQLETKQVDVKVDVKEVAKNVVESPEFKEAISSISVQTKALNNKEEITMNVSIKEMNEAIAKQDFASYKQVADKYMEESDFFMKAVNDPKNYTKGFAHNLQIKCSGKGLVISGNIQAKATLVPGLNTGTYSMSDVEFADVFAPGIIDTFNNQINLFGYLKKEQHIGGNYYEWKMVTNRDPQSNSTFVAQNDVSVLKNYANMLNYRTPLKVARRGVSVADFIDRYSARSLGNLFQIELDLQMKEMMKDVNISLFGEVADGTNNTPLGLEAVADSAGNTTLYGYTRSTDNRLAPAAAGDTYTAVSGSLTEAYMRAKRSNMEKEGSRTGDIVIVTSPTGRDYLFNLMSGTGIRTYLTTQAQFGYNTLTVPSWDGTPVIVDSDCTSTATASSGAAMYFIDSSADCDVIVIAMAPTITNLAKVGAATEAYVEMDFAHVYKQPRRIGMLNSLTGP